MDLRKEGFFSFGQVGNRYGYSWLMRQLHDHVSQRKSLFGRVISQDIYEDNLKVSEKCSIMYYGGMIT
jgi:hypothetical protein